MPRTPDSKDGPSYEEGIIWDPQPSDPTDELRQSYVDGKGLVILEDGIVQAVGQGREAYTQPPVDDRDVNTPPGSPVDGERVIVGSTPTGAFVGHAGEIAQWSGSAWVFTAPKQGMTTYVLDEDKLYKQTTASAPWTWKDAALPDATALGQILISKDGATFEKAQPLVSGRGGPITNRHGYMVVKG